MKILIGLIIAAGIVTATEAPAPKLSDTTRAKLWRIIADSNSAQLRYTQEQNKLREIQEVIRKECGGSFDLDHNGEPQCTKKPTTEEKEGK